MKRNPLVSFTTNLPLDVRNKLRQMAARKNIENQERVTSCAEIARRILIQEIRNMEENKYEE